MGSEWPDCIKCKRFIKHLQQKMVCTEYSKGIPHEIVMGKKCKSFEPETGKKKKWKEW